MTEAETQLKGVVAAVPMVEGAPRAVVFSVADAKRALPYVARVARDASEAFLMAQQCRLKLESHDAAPHRALLIQQRDEALHRLNAAIDDCNAVGADLVDIAAGVVRFNARAGDDVVELIWRLGEAVESAWEDGALTRV